LAYIETLHPASIAMGLERVRVVLDAMRISLRCPVITVGGTNGKGSTCAIIDCVLRASGYRVGLYTSPHLLAFNERIQINGTSVSASALRCAFQAVDDARGTSGRISDACTPLTYFEFTTLAALWLFSREALDAIVLEVGLGGRLDAVNAVDADVSVVTSVDIDHVDYLGSTREAIGREKAGIFRPRRAAICGDPKPPISLIEYATTVGADLRRIGVDYGYRDDGARWRYWSGERFVDLTRPALRGAYQLANTATAIAALEALGDRLTIDDRAINLGLAAVRLAGRFDVTQVSPTIIVDVAHNPHAARALAEALGNVCGSQRAQAVLGCMADKDIRGIVNAVKGHICRWNVASLSGPRGASSAVLRSVLLEGGIAAEAIGEFATPEDALAYARAQSRGEGVIVVFGSFATAAAGLATRETKGTTP